MRKITRFVNTFLTIMAVGTASAQVPATELVYPKPQDPVELGTSVAVYDQYALAGTKFENDVIYNGQNNTYTGAIRLFRNNQYVRTYTYGNGASVGLAIKNTMDIGQHCIAAGAPFKVIGGQIAGTVVLANRLYNGDYHSTLNYNLVPEPQDIERNLEFGCAVSTDGDWVAIGARGRNNKTGGVYMFQRTGYWQWVRRGWVPTPSLPTSSYFGNDVKISGDQMIVGSLNAFYIYKLNNGTWTLTGQASAPNNKRIGEVGIANNHAVAAYTDGVLVYQKSWSGSWSHLQTFLGSFLGLDVAISNQNLVISDNQKIYYYQLQNGFKLIGSMYIPNTNPATGRIDKQRIGYDIDIHGERIIASATNTNYTTGNNHGAVFTDFFYNGWANQNHLRAASEENMVSGTSEFRIYPNPSAENINIDSEGELVKVTATSMDGKENTVEFSGKKILTEQLSSGMYMLHVETSNGSFNTKFVKE